MGEIGTVFVFERSPYWTPELQRQLDPAEVTVRRCRSVADVQRLAFPPSGAAQDDPRVILLDLQSGPADCLQLLGTGLPQVHQVPLIVYASRRAADLEWPLREAGATDVIVEHVPGRAMARLCRRLLLRCQPIG
ncbi:MAG TPA: hypothetical protein EYP14_01895 [Planctomycetaceae bacterium]|nr:hypothetical protein [Planctomycetaceae bacterium]